MDMLMFFYLKSHADTTKTGKYQIVIFACLCPIMKVLPNLKEKISFITEFSFFLID